MPIFATHAGGTPFSSSVLTLRLSDRVRDGSLLAYDALKGVWVDVCIGPPLSTAVQLGGANTHGVLVPPSGSTLTFKEIKAGPGISLSSDGQAVTIGANVAAGRLSVPGDYRITIDNDNSGHDGRFEIYTVGSSLDNPLGAASAAVNPLTATVRTELGGWFGPTGAFVAPDADFEDQGFQPGMWVRASNAGAQTGTYQVADVVRRNQDGNTVSALIMTDPFVGPAANEIGGPKPDVVFEHLPVQISEHLIAAYGVDFGPDGLDFRPGMVVRISGTPDNDGVYAVDVVLPLGDDPLVASALGVSTGTPFTGTLGPQATPQVSFEVGHYEQPTGFYVDRQGHLVARSAHLGANATLGEPVRGAYQPQNPNDLVRKDNLDAVADRTSQPMRYFLAML